MGVGGGGGSSGGYGKVLGGNGRAWRRASLSFSWQWDLGESKNVSMEILVVRAVVVVMLEKPDWECSSTEMGKTSSRSRQSKGGFTYRAVSAKQLHSDVIYQAVPCGCPCCLSHSSLGVMIISRGSFSTFN